MIVPIFISSTDRFLTLRKICQESNQGCYSSNFGVQPAKLFYGVDKRLTTFISARNVSKIFSTKYYRWLTDEIEGLFNTLKYSKTTCHL